MSEIPYAELVDERPKPWGFWATMGLSLVVIALSWVIQSAVAIGLIVVACLDDPGFNVDRFVDEELYSGLLLSLATWTALPACLGLIWLLARCRRGWSARNYLALDDVSGKTAALWLFLAVVLAACTDGFTHALGRPIVPEFMVQVYKTAGWLPLLVLTLVVAAPLFEEILIRGFMFRGIASSRLGGLGAILITDVIWTAMHVQYDLFGMGVIFAIGILLGLARLVTGSVWLTIVMHALLNLIATIEVMVYVNQSA